jgi:hypothetical protein
VRARCRRHRRLPGSLGGRGAADRRGALLNLDPLTT